MDPKPGKNSSPPQDAAQQRGTSSAGKETATRDTRVLGALLPRWFGLSAEEATDGLRALKDAASHEGEAAPRPTALALQRGEDGPLGGWLTLIALGDRAIWLLYAGENAWEYDRVPRSAITRVEISDDGLGVTITAGDRTLQFVNFAVPDWLWELADELHKTAW